MACVEQHRLCHSATCSPYTCWRQARRHMMSQHLPPMDETTAQELEAFRVIGRHEVLSFLEPRGLSAFLPGQPNILEWRNIQIDPFNQWTWDVRAWFESSFLLFRVHLFEIITGKRANTGDISEQMRNKICGHALFLDGDYTNVNLLGLIVTLASVVILSICSHLEQLRESIYRIRPVFLHSCQYLTVGVRIKLISLPFPWLRKPSVGTNLAADPSEIGGTSDHGPSLELNLSAPSGREVV